MSVITPMRMVSAGCAQPMRDEKAPVVRAAAALPPMNCRRVKVMVFLPLFLFFDVRRTGWALLQIAAPAKCRSMIALDRPPAIEPAAGRSPAVRADDFPSVRLLLLCSGSCHQQVTATDKVLVCRER